MSSGSGYSGGRFRAAALHYVLGRGMNALASVALFVVLARTLSVPNYAAYVTMWAMLELALAFGNLGTEWVTATEVPRLRQAQHWSLLRRFIGTVLGVQALAFAVLGMVLMLLGPLLAAQAGWPLPAAVWPWLALHLWVEGLGRSLRDQLLSSLLLQGVAQAVQLVRNLVVLGGIAWLANAGPAVALLQVAQLETLASAGALTLALLNLGWHVRHSPLAPAAAPAPDWVALRRMAGHAWLGSLAALLVSPQVLVLMAARFLGAEATALLGFARNLAEQVRRFMPIEFGFSILRTFLVTRFRSPADLPALVDRCQVAWKLNLALLLPLLACAWVWGADLAAWVGGEKFRPAGALLAVWLLWVFTWSHHRLSELWAHLLQRSSAVGRTSFGLAFMPLLLAWPLAMQQPAWAVALLALGEGLYALRVGKLALRGAVGYPWARLRAARWLAGLGLAAGGGLLWRAAQAPWMLGAAGVALLLWGWLALSRTIGPEDWARWRGARALEG